MRDLDYESEALWAIGRDLPEIEQTLRRIEDVQTLRLYIEVLTATVTLPDWMRVAVRNRAEKAAHGLARG